MIKLLLSIIAESEEHSIECEKKEEGLYDIYSELSQLNDLLEEHLETSS